MTDPEHPAPTTLPGMVAIMLGKFGKDVTIALIFAAAIAYAARQVYSDLIISNTVIIEIARDRARRDQELSEAMRGLTKQVEGTNAIIAERVRQINDQQK